MKNKVNGNGFKPHRGRHGVMIKLKWARDLIKYIEKDALVARKSHKKILVNEIYANALLNHIADICKYGGVKISDLPAMNKINVG